MQSVYGVAGLDAADLTEEEYAALFRRFFPAWRGTGKLPRYTFVPGKAADIEQRFSGNFGSAARQRGEVTAPWAATDVWATTGPPPEWTWATDPTTHQPRRQSTVVAIPEELWPSEYKEMLGGPPFVGGQQIQSALAAKRAKLKLAQSGDAEAPSAPPSPGVWQAKPVPNVKKTSKTPVGPGKPGGIEP